MPRSSGRSSGGRRSSGSSKSSGGWTWGSSGSSKSSAGKSAARSSSQNARSVSHVASQSTPPAPSKDSEKGSKMSFGDAIKEGIGFGAGNSIGHRIADSLFGPRVIQYEAVASSDPASAQDSKTDASVACSNQLNSFLDCVYSNASDISKCQFYMDMLQECRIGSDAAALNA